MPASPDSLTALLIEDDQATIYAAFLAIAQSIGLPVTSWQPGDPTRSLGMLESSTLEDLEKVVVGFIGSGFLDYAQGTWLTICAQQGFNVIVPSATYATTAVTLTNAGGGVYTIEPGDLTVSNSSSGATYHNTSGGTLNALGTLSVNVIADQAGSAGSAGATEIDTLQTALLGVTCSNPTAAVGLDQQAPAITIAQCRNKLGSLSPNGPAAAYEYVALNGALTGVPSVTQARVYPDSRTGNVTIYVAESGAGAAPSDVAAVQAAIEKWATPLCITPTVISATPVAVAVTYTIWVYSSVNQNTTQIERAIQTALENWFAARPIGGDIVPPATSGSLYKSMVEAVIGSVYPTQTFRVSVSLPSGDVSLGNGDVAALGTITPTVNIIAGP